MTSKILFKSHIVSLYLFTHFQIERNESYPSKICPECNFKANGTLKFLDKIKKSQPKIKEILIDIGLLPNTNREQLLEVEIKSAAVAMQQDPFENTLMLPVVKTEPQDDDDGITAFDPIEDIDIMPEENYGDVKVSVSLLNPLVEVAIPIKTEKQNVRAFAAGPPRVFKPRLRTTKFKSANPHKNRVGIRSCDLCGFEYNSYAGIRRHVEHEHVKKKLPPHQPYKCPECELSFTSAYHLRKHKSLVHFDKSLFLCKECGLQLHSNDQLNSHIRSKHSPKVICTYCAQFISEKLMSKHIRAKHAPCECKYCEKKFTGEESKWVHIMKEHGSGPHPCPYCQNISKGIKRLNAHIKEVHGDIQLHCLVEGCNFATPSRGNLKNHLHYHKDIDVSLRERLLMEIDLFSAAREKIQKLNEGQ